MLYDKMIYDDYIQYCNVYTEKYGYKTVVFMQVGDFFELYAIQNETEQLGADIFKIAELCNIQVSRKNKSILEISRQNPLMAGFPIAAISKFIQVMLQANYTCILIRQVTDPPNPKRAVTEIISPSMTLTTQSNEGIYLMVIHWDLVKEVISGKPLLHLGTGIIDITTGKSWIYEAYSTLQDPDRAKDEAFRLINVFQPKELVFIGELTESVVEDIESMLCHQKNMAIHRIWCPEKIKYFKQISYQNTILEKVFGKAGILNPIELLHLEKYIYATIAYCYMIQFAYEHNESIVQHIQLPIQLRNTTHLILEANCIYQLNLVSNQPGETPLIDLLTRTSTAFGSRLFRERLLNPIVSVDELNKQYDRIEFYKEKGLYKTVLHLLSNILDLERIIRKIGLTRLQPSEWCSLHLSLEMATKVYTQLGKEDAWIHSMIQDYSNTLNLEECSKYNLIDIHTSIFKEGVYPELDAVHNTMKQSFDFINTFANAITNVGTGETTLCRVDCNDRDGYFLTMTKKRWDGVQKEAPKLVKGCQTKAVSSSSNILRITHPDIDKHSDIIISAQCKLSILNIDYYKKYLDYFYKVYEHSFQSLVKDLASIDIACTNAKNAVEYHYCRPKLVLSNNSYINAKGLRHPIIERLNIKTHYVTNDICLDNNHKGILLYGINAAGKSSLMKSIGLNVIMAQSGMYVAANEFILSPYYHLFTRISGMDNIYRGLSTFTVEMLELKNILNRCDDRSLVLGDELCAGTEAVSGISIVAAGIHELLAKKSNFIFATHLHELLEIDFIKSHEKIQILHMHIEFDPVTHKIIYDRTLKPGNGSPLYGLEVCKFLKMSEPFLEIANTVRKTIQKVPLYIVEPKVSKYHKDVYVSHCELCGKTAHETHHILQQKDADEDGFINTIHKDHPSNLLVLCEACHKKQHHGEVKIEKKILTSEGLEFKIISQNQTEESQPKLMSSHLMYQRSGWYYRLKEIDSWKKLSPRSYKTVFTKLNKLNNTLPYTEQEIISYLQDNQSNYLVL